MAHNDFLYAIKRFHKHARDVVKDVELVVKHRYERSGWHSEPFEDKEQYYGAVVGDVGMGKLALYGITGRGTKQPKCKVATECAAHGPGFQEAGSFGLAMMRLCHASMNGWIDDVEERPIINNLLSITIHTQYDLKTNKILGRFVIDYPKYENKEWVWGTAGFNKITNQEMISLMYAVLKGDMAIQILIERATEIWPNDEKLMEAFDLMNRAAMKGKNFVYQTKGGAATLTVVHQNQD
jgi:hypothetical protein